LYIRQFELDEERKQRIGEVAFLGYPFEHLNLTCHAGTISSYYTSGRATIVQLDASVNPSNSGGPLLDVNTGRVIGIVTRRATGLTQAFAALRQTIHNNIAQLLVAQQGGTVALFGMSPIQAIELGQNQMLMTLGEIERQANVGIGYAMSIEHILNDNVLARKIGGA
jgi:S1-C subfamily serine protease